MLKLLVLITIIAGGAQAAASGCDCSCFGVKEKILRQDVHDSYHFTVAKDGENLVLTPIPGRYNHVKEPVTISGYKNRIPLHPRLIERILTEKNRFTLRRYNMQLTVENDWCPLDVGQADTGRMQMEVVFETGEEVTLWHPSDEVLFDRETGNIQTQNLIPFPLKEQVKP
jgi:hypothetical protein